MCSGQTQDELTAANAERKLMYYGYAPVNVRGPVTGQLYHFTRISPVQQVDERDAVSMLKTRLFRQIR